MPRQDAREAYQAGFMAALAVLATRGRHVNVLQHMAGYLHDGLDAASREELQQTLADASMMRRRGALELAGARRHIVTSSVEPPGHGTTPRVASLTWAVCTIHTAPMKVAVSVPDTVFEAAERVSRRMRVSRSRLYAKAVEAYVKQHSEEDITEQLNKVYAGNSSTLDPAMETASLEVLRRERWE